LHGSPSGLPQSVHYPQLPACTSTSTTLRGMQEAHASFDSCACSAAMKISHECQLHPQNACCNSDTATLQTKSTHRNAWGQRKHFPTFGRCVSTLQELLTAKHCSQIMSISTCMPLSRPRCSSKSCCAAISARTHNTATSYLAFRAIGCYCTGHARD